MLGTGVAGAPSLDLTMEIDSAGQVASKHKAEAQGGPESKSLKFDSDPVPEQKVKAKMNVRRTGDVEITRNDVLGCEDDWKLLAYNEEI